MENSSRNRDENQRIRGNHPQNQPGLKRESGPDRNSRSRSRRGDDQHSGMNRNQEINQSRHSEGVNREKQGKRGL